MLKSIRELNLLAQWRYVLAEPTVFKSGLVHGRIYNVDEDTGEITEYGKHHKRPVAAMAYDVGCEIHDLWAKQGPFARYRNWCGDSILRGLLAVVVGVTGMFGAMLAVVILTTP